MKEVIKDDPQAIIYAMDEAGIKRQSSITSGWFVRGEKAIVLSSPTHEKVNLVGAVKLSNGAIIIDRVNQFCQDDCIGFLKKIAEKEAGTKGAIYVILDNARPHRAKSVKEYLEQDPNNRIVLLFLPPYSPELNPSESIWLQLRREKTHNIFFETMIALNEAITAFENKYSMANKPMESLCAIF